VLLINNSDMQIVTIWSAGNKKMLVRTQVYFGPEVTGGELSNPQNLNKETASPRYCTCLPPSSRQSHIAALKTINNIKSLFMLHCKHFLLNHRQN
jgi:hypothetical protein